MRLSRQGLESPERLRGERLFKKICRKGCAYEGKRLTLSWLANELPMNRIGIFTGRIRIKSSVERNRLKRICREIYRLNKDKLKEGFDLIIIPKSLPQGRVDFWDLQNEFLGLIEKAGLLK